MKKSSALDSQVVLFLNLKKFCNCGDASSASILAINSVHLLILTSSSPLASSKAFFSCLKSGKKYVVCQNKKNPTRQCRSSNFVGFRCPRSSKQQVYPSPLLFRDCRKNFSENKLPIKSRSWCLVNKNSIAFFNLNVFFFYKS